MNKEHVAPELDVKLPGSIRADVLKTLSYRDATHPVEIEYWTEEFAFHRPGAETPALGSLYVRYVPSGHLVDSDSLRRYLLQYTNVVMLHEQTVTRVLNDLVKSCQPQSMAVEVDFAPQDGLGIRVKAHYQKARL